MVKYSLRWSAQSKNDLKEIFDFIKNMESQERAKYVVSNIRKEAKKITVFPTKHAIEAIIVNESVRYAIKWNYKILFTLDDKHINIVRIFHTAQNPALLVFS